MRVEELYPALLDDRILHYEGELYLGISVEIHRSCSSAHVVRHSLSEFFFT